MPTIGAAVNAETKARFEANALAQNKTASSLAASLITDYLGRVDGTGPTAPLYLSPPMTNLVLPPLSTRTERVHVRLDPYHYAELGRMASERQWHRGTYLANLFHAHHGRGPVLCDAEINALRQVARQLADLGRNFNQIARKLNSSLDNAHVAMGTEFELVRMLIDLEAAAVKNLLKANIKGWGISDVEA